MGLTVGGKLTTACSTSGRQSPVADGRSSRRSTVGQRGRRERQRHIYSYAGKVTWQAATAQRVDVSLFGDPSAGPMGLQRAEGLLADNLAPRISALRYGANNQVAKYDAVLSDDWLVEVSVARNVERFEETPALQEWAVTDFTVVPNVRSGGIGSYESGTRGRNGQYQAKSTHLIDSGRGGTHQLRYGAVLEDIAYDHFTDFTGPTFTLPNGVETRTGAEIQIRPAPELPGGRLYRVRRASTRTGRATTQRYLSFFVQDTWQVGNLTLRPGVRFEQQTLRGRRRRAPLPGGRDTPRPRRRRRRHDPVLVHLG